MTEKGYPLPERQRSTLGDEASAVTVRDEWDSLFKSINFWLEYERKQGAEQLAKLVSETGYFAYKFYQFFERIDPEIYRADRTNLNVVLYQAQARLVAEWDTIQQALEQRDLVRYRDRLRHLDQLAQESLSPVLPVDTAARAVTYFHKVYDITRFAFSQAPLIGAPYSALHLPESWLAIPHEAGHYIFWNGPANALDFSEFRSRLETAVVQRLAASLEMTITNRTGMPIFRHIGQVFSTWLGWLEELFADIYGTLVAGPASGWAMQTSLASRTDDQTLGHDDGEHPSPYLRPFTHVHVLRRMAALEGAHPAYQQELHDIADAQENAWRKRWPEAAKLDAPDGRGRIELMVADLAGIVDAVLEVPMSVTAGQPCLRELFQQGKFYTAQRHAEVIAVVDRTLGDAEPDCESILSLSAAAQLAILRAGADKVSIRRKLGFAEMSYRPQLQSLPSERANELDGRFMDYMTGATNEQDRTKWPQQWQAVIGSNLTLDTGTFHWHAEHHHPHAH